MKLFRIIIITFIVFNTVLYGQQADTVKKTAPDKSGLKFNISADGSRYFQVVFLNQVWLRYNESNPGTTRFSKATPETFDIGLRRTRVQMYGQITDRAFVYFQFGQNNFNSTAQYSAAGTGNRKIAAFFHDALAEYKISKGNQLKLGGGLTVLNGLSRFSQPSVGSILSLDVPVFLQYTVDQTDQFDRRLAVYARGQAGKFDYRIYLSNPFPINTNGSIPPPIGRNATFVNTGAIANGSGPGVNNQFGGYFAYNFLDNENHTTPYMQGTYLGSKRVWNIAVGGVYQKNATWNLEANKTGTYTDTVYNNMLHFSVETFLDMPLNKEKGTMISAFAGYYNTNYGTKYLRYNGIMNPATGALTSALPTMVQASSYGNAVPMFGTGQVAYAQIGFMLPKSLLGEKNGQLMPYLTSTYADYTALQNKASVILDAGINWFMNGHRSKISLDYQSRPTFYTNATNKDIVSTGPRKSSVTLQYQIMF
ncbi:hypothetical protein CNR22_23590 [Sphingobacteriaceae bacterium]|nr:hypothetical protein CNR22_23590 [Sphingobacteriaceae bacterium]